MIDVQSEKAIIGNILVNEYFSPILNSLDSEDFGIEYYGEIFTIAKELQKKSKDVNIISVLERLPSISAASVKNILEEYLPVSNLSYCVTQLKKKSFKRKFSCSLLEIIEKVKEKENDDLILETLKKIEDLAEENKRTKKYSRYSLNNSLRDFYGEIEKSAPQGINVKRKIETGFDNFDKFYGGLRKGSLIYLGGRPSTGKSTLSLQWALEIAKNDIPVYFFSFEISKIDLLSKIICLNGNINSHSINYGPIDENLCRYISKNCSSLYDVPFYFSDRSMKPEEIKLESCRVKNLGLIVIDRIEIISDRQKNTETRNNQLARISNELNKMAVELDIPVLVLVQLSRFSTQKGIQPTLSDLRDSGSLEQDAKMVLLLHKEKERTELICAKNMFGRTGKIDLKFIADIPKFQDITI